MPCRRSELEEAIQEELDDLGSFYTCMSIIGVFVGCFGVLGNGLIIWVLSTLKSRQKHKWTQITIILAICDIFVIVSCIVRMDFLLVLIFLVGKNYSTFTVAGPFLHLIFDPAFLTAWMASTCFTLLLTLERFQSVCAPLEFYVRSKSKKVSRLEMGLAAIVPILYNFPAWFEKRVVKHTDMESGNSSFFELVHTQFGSSSVFQFIYGDITFNHTLRCVIPFFIFLYFNIKIRKEFRKQREIRMQLGVSYHSTTESCLENSDHPKNPSHISTAEVGMTKVSITILLVSLISNISFLIYLALLWVGGVDGRGRRSKFYTLGMFMILLNSSANFAVHFCVSKSFRAKIKTIFQHT